MTKLKHLKKKMLSSRPHVELTTKSQDAFSLYQRGHLAAAKTKCEEILSTNPRHSDSLYLLGVIAAKSGYPQQAIDFLDRAISVNSGRSDFHFVRAVTLQGLQRLNEAVASYTQAIAIKADHFEAYFNRGNALRALHRLDEAVASYDKAIGIKPDFVEAYSNRGLILQDLKRFDQALSSYDKALSLKPGLAMVHYNRANVLKELKQFDEAVAGYDKAITITPGYAEAYCNRGNALRELHRLEEAVASYDKAIAIKPDHAVVWSDRGNALLDLRHLDEAIASYDKAIAINPNYANAYCSKGHALGYLQRIKEAVTCYNKAITIKPDYAEAYCNRGFALQDLKRLDEAIASYDKAIGFDPDIEFIQGTLLNARMQICDWTNLPQDISKIESGVNSGDKIAAPFAVLALLDSPGLQKKAAEIFAPPAFVPTRLPAEANRRDHRIRLGYFSADFFNHATMYLMAELFDLHDTSKFHVFGFSFGPQAHDEMSSRASSAIETFIDVSNKSDREIIALANQLELDIAVDLKGYTKYARPGIFAGRCAPVQVSYLGYPGTMGAEYIDYIIADATVIPDDCMLDYTEKIVVLPDSYQVNDSKRNISSRTFSRKEMGLPESGFVFCCFNNNYKMLPATFDVWMRLLQSVQNSVLWLLGDNPSATHNLRMEAAARGVASERLVFAERMPLDEHLARHRLADLFLDTLPYNAHTTASDALWAGVPVLTCAGKSFAGRVAASLLNAIGLPELITGSYQEYEKKAVELATHVDKLAQIRAKLETNRSTCPLFNTGLFTRHIESAYQRMHAQSLAGLPPENIVVPRRE